MQKLTGSEIPSVLREIPQPPKELWLDGELPNFDDYIYLAVVGSRKFTNYGRECCEKLIMGLAGKPVCIVSGLAIGIDTLAHKTALCAGLPTVAVLPSGVDRKSLYPRQNVKLADEIVKSGGALLSENTPGFKAALYSFPQRNRIMAGLSKAVLIIEAGDRSGTLVTARMALDYNRTVLVVPGSIFNQSSIGANRLLKQGASPVCSSEDILIELGLESESGQALLDLSSLSELEKKVYEILIEPLPRDDLLRELNLEISEANSLLTMMEIKGLIKESLGEMRIS
ncbi:MAG: DNA-processing protein DprA [Candidatus Paceibacterota bacterium]|jgi:DNA processing protein